MAGNRSASTFPISLLRRFSHVAIHSVFCIVVLVVVLNTAAADAAHAEEEDVDDDDADAAHADDDDDYGDEEDDDSDNYGSASCSVAVSKALLRFVTSQNYTYPSTFFFRAQSWYLR